ncbi:MAG: DUF3473 domain-containing protein [Aquisalinus sp.]|nr:DUF3473 domain-containing protein [Aquisalinus sp.]
MSELITSSETPAIKVQSGMNAISVDVEDYFQVWALSEVIKREDWDDIPLRVESATRTVLDLFDRTQSKGTFFTLGWVAERAPALMREIVARGHEVASHGYDHTKVFDQSSDEFRADIRKTKQILEDITGQSVRGFRAAGFSLDDRTPWAHEILCEEGYKYSSSVHPIAHDHYHAPDAPRFAWSPLKDNVAFLEIPVSTTMVAGRRVSCAGGGWFRAMPYNLSHALLSRMITKDDQPAVFYFHPWEVDPEQPKVSGLSRKSRLRHYLNLERMEGKLERLLGSMRWGRIDEIFPVKELQEAA